IFECSAMECVSTGAKLQLHICSRMAAILGRVVPGLHLELMYRVNGREHENRIAAVIDGCDAVERQLLILASGSVRTETATGGAARGDHSRNQVPELRKIPAIERQIHNALRRHRAGHDAALRLQQDTLRVYLNLLTDLAHL